jgi:hypothetical protein
MLEAVVLSRPLLISYCKIRRLPQEYPPVHNDVQNQPYNDLDQGGIISAHGCYLNGLVAIYTNEGTQAVFGGGGYDNLI